MQFISQCALRGLFAAGLLTLGLTGCGGAVDGREAISGTVTHGGEPLNQGVIEFISQDGSHQSGATITNGEYSVSADQGLPPGQYTVRISSGGEGAAVDASQPPGPESMEAPAKDLIPEEYNVHSRLTAEVVAGGDNKFDFKIPK